MNKAIMSAVSHRRHFTAEVLLFILELHLTDAEFTKLCILMITLPNKTTLNDNTDRVFCLVETFHFKHIFPIILLYFYL